MWDSCYLEGKNYCIGLTSLIWEDIRLDIDRKKQTGRWLTSKKSSSVLKTTSYFEYSIFRFHLLTFEAFTFKIQFPAYFISCIISHQTMQTSYKSSSRIKVPLPIFKSWFDTIQISIPKTVWFLKLVYTFYPSLPYLKSRSLPNSPSIYMSKNTQTSKKVLWENIIPFNTADYSFLTSLILFLQVKKPFSSFYHPHDLY